MVEESNGFKIDVTQADVQSVMNENPIVALQVQVKALMRYIKDLSEENVRLRSEAWETHTPKSDGEAIY